LCDRSNKHDTILFAFDIIWNIGLWIVSRRRKRLRKKKRSIQNRYCLTSQVMSSATSRKFGWRKFSMEIKRG